MALIIVVTMKGNASSGSSWESSIRVAEVKRKRRSGLAFPVCSSSKANAGGSGGQSLIDSVGFPPLAAADTRQLLVRKPVSLL